MNDYREFLRALPWSVWNKSLPKTFLSGVLPKIWLGYKQICTKVI